MSAMSVASKKIKQMSNHKILNAAVDTKRQIVKHFFTWGNIWWLYEPYEKIEEHEKTTDTSWQHKKPSLIYTTLMEAMKELKTRNS